ncbi:hypothetical protein EY643_05215 [Halioglobus maricola]|uniref:Uncharacterized protein n=1 Tax=Halioglobus maricola TaxID=2601894 RepID=A0A5P9NIP9_9GAMM|nr:hypothetical protein [Halioglobus maricola]QFU75094.1 hypothetical protein EY643_05215 [Halioglobus maricola]
MWRYLSVFVLLLAAVVFLQSQAGQVAPGHVALVQLQDCLELNLTHQMAGQGEGLSLSGIARALGIGILSILFFVPAALLAELLSGGGDDRTAA